jgi:hypothetical protein
MIELADDGLVFRFPHLGEEAEARVGFQRTLRVPDTGRTYPLPAGLGCFPLRHVEDYTARLPESIIRRGGLLMPMWQAEAMWVSFSGGWGEEQMPCAVKVAAGKTNAVSGESWREGLHREPQDYCALPDQPWLDGFAVAPDVVRQFVAMPLGVGVTAEEQLTGAAEHGGLQIAVTPLTEPAYARWREEMRARPRSVFCANLVARQSSMGLAPGGRIQQVVHKDRRPLEDYDTARTLRVFVTILDAVAWRHVTGEAPPTMPPTAKDYAAARIPWFQLYERDVAAIGGTATLKRLRSVGECGVLGKPDEDIAVSDPVMLSRPPRPGRRPVRPWGGASVKG